MGATPSIDQSDADDARFVACPEKAEGRTEVRRTGYSPPTPAPPAQERPRPTRPPSHTSGDDGTQAAPPPPPG